jgi:hypothetical protein
MNLLNWIIDTAIAFAIGGCIVALVQLLTLANANASACIDKRIEDHHMGCIRGVAMVRNDLDYNQVDRVCKQIRLIREIGLNKKTTKDWSKGNE